MKVGYRTSKGLSCNIWHPRSFCLPAGEECTFHRPCETHWPPADRRWGGAQGLSGVRLGTHYQECKARLPCASGPQRDTGWESTLLWQPSGLLIRTKWTCSGKWRLKVCNVKGEITWEEWKEIIISLWFEGMNHSKGNVPFHLPGFLNSLLWPNTTPRTQTLICSRGGTPQWVAPRWFLKRKYILIVLIGPRKRWVELKHTWVKRCFEYSELVVILKFSVS